MEPLTILFDADDVAENLLNRPHNRGLDVEKYGVHRAETWDEVDALVERFIKERCV